MQQIAQRLTKEAGEDVDTTAVDLLWVKAKGGVAVTSSANPANIKNLAKTGRLQVSLTQEEVVQIDNIATQYHFRYYVRISVTCDFKNHVLNLPSYCRTSI